MRQLNKKSGTASAVPGTQIALGEITTNTPDGNIHIKQSNASGDKIIELYKGMKIHKVQDETERDNLVTNNVIYPYQMCEYALDGNTMLDLWTGDQWTLVEKTPPQIPPPLVIKWSRVGPDDPISVEISGADMEYSNDNGATWSIISAGSRQDLATVPGGGITGYILRETVSLGPVTRCAFCEEGLPQAMRSDITVTGGYNLTDTSWMFGGFQTYWDNGYDSCYTIDVSGLDTTNTTTMFNMFKSNEMTIIGAENFKTSNVITMEGLFKGGNDAPRELDLSRWDTSNVTNMKYMFGNSPGLAILNVDGWDTSNVTSFYGWNPQGGGSSSLTEIELSSFDTSSAVDMTGFLAYQGSLTTVGVSDLGQLDLSSCTIAEVMMSGHSKLLKLDVSEWDVSRIEDFSGMISNFESVEVLDVSKWNIPNCKRFAFVGCTKVKVFDISNWNSNYSLNLDESFENCHSLEHIDISTLSVTTAHKTFLNCNSLKTVKLSDTFECTKFNEMFEGCSALTCINNINTTNATPTPGATSTTSGLPLTGKTDMFLNCGSLVNPDATAQADIADANGANWTGPACP